MYLFTVTIRGYTTIRDPKLLGLTATISDYCIVILNGTRGIVTG
jgi:hypothetical protein